MATMATALLILLLLATAVYAAGIPINWAKAFADKTYEVGDFIDLANDVQDAVYKVSQFDYNNCKSSNPLESYHGGNTRINFTAPGTQYYICSDSARCLQGMRLAATVEAASSPGTNTPSGSSSSTPATSGTPTSTTSSPPNGATCFFYSLYYNVMAVLISFLVVAVMA